MEMRQQVMKVGVSPLASVKNELRYFILERPKYHGVVYLNRNRTEEQRILVPQEVYDELLMEFKSHYDITKDMRVKSYYQLMRTITYRSKSKIAQAI